jgi:nucleoside-diphosphate-sugar epimerase
VAFYNNSFYKEGSPEKSMVKDVLITGGAGFIGFHLADYLSNQGQNITILDNLSRGEDDKDFRKLLKKDNIRFVYGDITDQKTFDGLGKDFDYVYHLAAINGTENFYNIPHEVLRVGIVGTINVLDWFVKQKKGKLLFSSSSEVYAGALKLMGDKFPIPTPEEIPLVIDVPSNLRWSYGSGKMLGEVAMHSYAFSYKMDNFVITRYHNIYGPRMGFEHVIPQFIERIVKKEDPFKIFGGKETRAFCYMDDGLRATQLVMESPRTNGKTIHIGRSDDEIKIKGLAKKLFKIAGVNPELEIFPAPKGSVKRRCPDTTKLQKFGFAPKVSLEDGLRQTYDWYKDKF